MTKRKDFKTRVRERMDRTGESYCAARNQVVPKPPKGRLPDLQDLVAGLPLMQWIRDHVEVVAGRDPFWSDGITGMAAYVLGRLLAEGAEASASGALMIIEGGDLRAWIRADALAPAGGNDWIQKAAQGPSEALDQCAMSLVVLLRGAAVEQAAAAIPFLEEP